MRIVVCVKFVNREISPFDASALECALRLRDVDPSVEVAVLSMARTDCAEPLRALTRLGVSRAILLSDSAFAGADTLATAYALSLTMERLAPDLILCGRQSIDGDTAQTGPALASLLGCSVLTNVLRMELSEGGMLCETRFGREQAALPAVLTVERVASLRFPRMRSKMGEVEVWDRAAIGADPARCGLAGSPTRVVKSHTAETDRRFCRFVPFSELDAAIAAGIANAKAAAAATRAPVEKKLPEVWCVGEGPRAWAERIAERVHVLPEGSVDALTEAIRAGNPDVVLWDGGLWGRRTAPQVAARLGTGLCADCTSLETDGESFRMVRPAFGGSLLATIICRTRPQMATVRPEGQEGAEVIVGVGAGCADRLEEIRAWAARRGYGLAVSRPVVDSGLAPYEEQVGLTGSTVRPAVYLAVGISGAVQHTCAIEQAGTVIAVNPDKSARIFDCADIGICAEFVCK